MECISLNLVLYVDANAGWEVLAGVDPRTCLLGGVRKGKGSWNSQISEYCVGNPIVRLFVCLL